MRLLDRFSRGELRLGRIEAFSDGVFAVNTVLFIALHAYILRRLIKPELAAIQDPRIIQKSWIGPLSYLVGAAAAWSSVYAAFVVYALTPLWFIVPPSGSTAAGRDA